VSRRLIVAADGGSRGNPGPAGYGALVQDAATGEVLAEDNASIGRASNNVAEYHGLIAGLRAAVRIAPGAETEVRMDSRLVVEQMSGNWKIRHPELQRLAETARELAGQLGPVRYTWVPRERNSHADRLANEAMDAAERADPGVADIGSRSEGKSVAAAPRASSWREASGPPTTTILLRHGQTPLSAERRFAGAGDIPLTLTGVEQARAAAGALADRGGIDLIVTSPLRRARLTAAEVAAATGATVQATDGLRETDFGKWEGLSFAEAREQWPGEMNAWLADAGSAPPGGESFADTGLRVNAALDALLAANQGQTIVIVSHVTPIKTLVTRALLAPPAAMNRMLLDVASLSEIDWYADGPAVLRSFNDTAHLRGM
jgi:probable phosphoglycerate mutase